MKMKTMTNDVPKAMRDVWAWRKALHKDLAGMPVDEVMHAITRRADESARRLHLEGTSRDTRVRRQVAEGGAEYGKGR